MANTFHAPKIIITDEEAARIAGAAQRVARHYNVPAMAQQTKDWIAFALALGSVYGPRVSSYMIEKKFGPAKEDEAGALAPENARVVESIIGAQPRPPINSPFPRPAGP